MTYDNVIYEPYLQMERRKIFYNKVLNTINNNKNNYNIPINTPEYIELHSRKIFINTILNYL